MADSVTTDVSIPSIDDLPAPPEERTGWPWTLPAEVERKVENRPIADTSAWPSFTIVTPSYNQDQFLEATLRSVLLQRYPNLEYIVLDGGSTDDSVDIIRRYAPWIDYWQSEPDGGQTHAINNGFRRAQGEIVQWVNSDDQLQPGALIAVGTYFAQHPESDFVVGGTEWIHPSGQTKRVEGPRVETFQELLYYHRQRFLSQPGVFFTRRLYEAVGPLDESLTYTMDLDLWLRIGRHVGPTTTVPRVDAGLARMTSHPDQKTSGQNQRAMEEAQAVVLRHASHYGLSLLERFQLWREWVQFRALHQIGKFSPNLSTLASLSRQWIRRVPAYLLTPSYWKIVLQCLLGRKW